MNFRLIEDILKEKNITQQEFCNNVGISLSGYQKAKVIGDTKLSIALKMATFLGVDISTLVEKKTNTYMLGESPMIYNKVANEDNGFTKFLIQELENKNDQIKFLQSQIEDLKKK